MNVFEEGRAVRYHGALLLLSIEVFGVVDVFKWWKKMPSCSRAAGSCWISVMSISGAFLASEALLQMCFFNAGPLLDSHPLSRSGR